jgi:hypothetical protein
MIVTYGGHGGNKCAAQLKSVLEGIRMVLTLSHVELKYPDMQFAKEKVFPGGDLGLDAESDGGVWAAERPKIVATFEELREALEESQKVTVVCRGSSRNTYTSARQSLVRCAPAKPGDLKVMGNRVSKYLRQEMVQQTGQLAPCETPRGNDVVRVTLLPISLL